MTNTREVTLSEMYPHYCWLLRCSGFSRQRNNRAGHGIAAAGLPIGDFG